MSLFNLYDDEVTLSELNQLILGKTSEKRTIDYKLALQLDGDEKKKEFLADIVSFANTNGGFLIYGMKEEAGIPIELVGISAASYDILKGQIESIIRDGIAPKLNSVIVADVHITEGRKAIVIKIPQSWSSPHLVWYKRSSKFYARNSSHGKYQLEVSEIRTSMLASEYLYEKVRDFRLDRISKIIKNDTPIELYNSPKFVFHIIPVMSFYSFDRISTEKYNHLINGPNPLHSFQKEFNFEGFLIHNHYNQPNPNDQYLQIFRNGIIEIVNTGFTNIIQEEKLIFGSAFETYYIQNISIWLELLKFLGLNFPYLLFLSVLEIKGYKFQIRDPHSFYFENKPINKENLLIPDILIEANFLEQKQKHLKILFDPIWNACNFDQSLNYKSTGEYVQN